jgi:hypothetical protein
MVDHNHDVFITWIEGAASGTLTLDPEHAIEIGRWGEMAKIRGEMDKLRKAVQENDTYSTDRI